MAWKWKYRCRACGYEADVYEGRGLFSQQITAMSCPDCKGGVRETTECLVEGTPSRTSSWVVSLQTWLHLTGARWGDCACNVAAIISVSGICEPVRSAREQWKIPAKKSFGREAKLRDSLNHPAAYPLDLWSLTKARTAMSIICSRSIPVPVRTRYRKRSQASTCPLGLLSLKDNR